MDDPKMPPLPAPYVHFMMLLISPQGLHMTTLPECQLTFTPLWANAADNKLIIFSLFFPENFWEN